MLSADPAGPAQLSSVSAGPTQLSFIFRVTACLAQLSFPSAGPVWLLMFLSENVWFSPFRLQASGAAIDHPGPTYCYHSLLLAPRPPFEHLPSLLCWSLSVGGLAVPVGGKCHGFVLHSSSQCSFISFIGC